MTYKDKNAIKNTRMLSKRPVIYQTGFTLIEFIVAAVLGLIVLLAIGGAYVATQKVNQTANTRVGRQQELRTANNMLIRDARMAGTFGCANVAALINDAGELIDHQATKLNISKDPSYMNIANSAGNDRVFGSRIISSTNTTSMLSSISPNFIPMSEAVVFNYGSNIQPLLNSTITNGNVLQKFSVTDGSAFAKKNSQSRFVLASCTRLDILSHNELTVNANLLTLKGVANIPVYKAGVSKSDVSGASGVLTDDQAQYVNQATISQLRTVMYVLGRIKGDTQSPALYRFEILDDGTWSQPQLLARNINSMSSRYLYVRNCADAASSAATEKFVVGKEAFKEDPTGSLENRYLMPTAIELTVTPTAAQMDLNIESASSANIATNANDNKPIVLMATIRGANTCATR